MNFIPLKEFLVAELLHSDFQLEILPGEIKPKNIYYRYQELQVYIYQDANVLTFKIRNTVTPEEASCRFTDHKYVIEKSFTNSLLNTYFDSLCQLLLKYIDKHPEIVCK